MILSASRRTDIPAYYLPWFVNRLRQGWALTRNPFNPAQVSRIDLSLNNLECIVFWSKNPAPLLDLLDELAPYPYYLQFTLNAYGRDLESELPDLQQRLATFKALSNALGPERVIWRYSPVIINQTYTNQFHTQAFAKLCAELSPHTRHCHLSFLDMYAKIAARLRKLGVAEQTEPDKLALAKQFAALAKAAGIALSNCGDPDLGQLGLPASTCVDSGLISRLLGAKLRIRKDSGQRKTCNCAESIDIGAYQTCLHGCAYCYANHSEAAVLRRVKAYDLDSALLCDALKPDDVVRQRAACIHAVSAGPDRQLRL